MKKIFLSLFLSAIITSNLGYAQSSIPDKKDDIKKLILALNSNVFEGINDWLVYSVTASLKNLYPQTDEKNIELAKLGAYQKISEKQDDLMELIVPIYSNQFTHDEIRDILYFAKTTSGQKFISANPELVKTIQDIVLDWSSSIAQEITEAAITHIPEAYIEGEPPKE